MSVKQTLKVVVVTVTVVVVVIVVVEVAAALAAVVVVLMFQNNWSLNFGAVGGGQNLPSSIDKAHCLLCNSLLLPHKP